MKPFAIAAVNLRRFLRDRSNVFFVFILPLALILVLGSVFGGSVTPRLGVVVEGRGALADRLVDGLDSRQGIELMTYDGDTALIDAVERGTVSAGLVIPADYDARLSRGDTAEVGFVARPGELGPQLRATVAAVVEEQARQIGAARFAATHGGLGFPAALRLADSVRASVPPIDVVTSGSQLQQGLRRFDGFAAPQLVLFTFLTGLAASAALIQSRQLGVSRRMLATPTSTRAIVAGEGLGRFAVALFQGAYIMAGTWILFGVTWGPAVPAVGLLVAFSLVGAGAGMLMGSVFSNDQQAGSVAVMTGLGLAALGGCMFPVEVFSPAMQRIARLTPHAWANEGFADLIRRGGGLADVLPEIGVLLAFAAVLLVLSAWRLRASLVRG
jgi:linearmycin/streptolysin S transport system permease protein